MPISAETYANRWWITFTVMLVAVIELLDTTIVNVSLPDMMGSLSANVDQITWVLTSYIVSAAIVMPLTGVLVNTFGRRKLLLGSVVGFLASSMLCGVATHLPEMVFFRILQGVFGASLVPLSQFVLRATFPEKEQGVAMAIWGMGIMCAPILGPAIGGVITQHLSWRWIFYINLPVCVMAYALVHIFIEDTEKKSNPIDWIGLGLMALGIGCFQVFLDRGNNVGWFDASSTRWLTVGFVVGLTLFVIRSLRTENPVVNLRLFKDRNFCVTTLLVMLFVLTVFGQVTLSPLMLQTLFNYPSIDAGFAMVPRGLASVISMAVTGRLINRYDPRFFIGLGMALSLYGTHLMANFTLDAAFSSYLWGSIFQGSGMGFFFVPLAMLSMATIPRTDIAGAAGLFGLSRNLGQSMGVSIMATVLSRMTQTNWNVLGGYVQPFSANLVWWQQSAGRSWHDPVTMQVLAQQVQNQAQMIAYNDVAWLSSVTLLCAIPFVFLLKKPTRMETDIHVH